MTTLTTRKLLGPTAEEHKKAMDTFLSYRSGYEDGYNCTFDSEMLGPIRVNKSLPNADELHARLKRTRSAYRAGWKAGRSKYLTGLIENASEMKLPIIVPDGLWHVQDGYKSGAYRERYTLESQIEARRWYEGLNIHSGYKKRLIGPDGVLEERYIS